MQPFVWSGPLPPRPGYGSKTRLVLLVIETLVDLCDLLHPTLALRMIQRQDLLMRPVKVVRNIRYLLIEPL